MLGLRSLYLVHSASPSFIVLHSCSTQFSSPPPHFLYLLVFISLCIFLSSYLFLYITLSSPTRVQQGLGHQRVSSSFHVPQGLPASPSLALLPDLGFQSIHSPLCFLLLYYFCFLIILVTSECFSYILFVFLSIFFISSIAVNTTVCPGPLHTIQSSPTPKFPPHSSYLLAQTPGHVVRLLVGFLGHCCCYWLFLLHSHLSLVFHGGPLRSHVQLWLYLDHILFHRYFIRSLHQSGSNRKIQSSQL